MAITNFETRLFINGEYVEAKSKERITVVNPANEEVVTENAQSAGADDVDAAVLAATAAFKTGPWSKYTAAQRAECLYKMSDLITANAKELAEIESVSMGSPMSLEMWVLKYAADVFKYYAGWADKIPGEQFPAEDGVYKIVSYEPYGVCAGIGAWNVSYVLLANKAAPALAAGNTFIYKSSEKSPLGCLAFGRLFNEAGFPPGVVNLLSGAGETGSLLASHMKIMKVSFTGSAFTGKKVAAMAASSNLKRCTLELGGKSPCIVFEDADIENALEVCSTMFLFNTTQACIATSRTFVHESIADKFIEALKQKFISAKATIGAPAEPTTAIGPLVDKKQFDRVMGYIESGKNEAELAIGGSRHGDKGWYVEPTIFLNPKEDARIWQEEIFGPVLSVRTFKTEDEAVKMANDTSYGLSSSIQTKSLSRALRVSRLLEAGTVAINQAHGPAMQIPFGGFKESGMGREGGRTGIMHYLQDKTILINMNV